MRTLGGDDPGMMEGADHAGLVGVHGGDPRIAPALRRQHLEHHAAAEGARPFELGQPDFAHVPQTQPLFEDIPPPMRSPAWSTAP